MFRIWHVEEKSKIVMPSELSDFYFHNNKAELTLGKEFHNTNKIIQRLDCNLNYCQKK